MSSYIKSGLCLAFTAFQVTPEDHEINVLHNKSERRKSCDHHHQHHHHHHQQYKTCDGSKVSASAGLEVVSASEAEVSASDANNSENVVPRYTRQDVQDHCDTDSCWIIINNKVYDVTRFLRLHPGGDIILEHGGCDATCVFKDVGHSKDAHLMLKEYFIGEVTKEDWLPELETDWWPTRCRCHTNTRQTADAQHSKSSVETYHCCEGQDGNGGQGQIEGQCQDEGQGRLNINLALLRQI